MKLSALCIMNRVNLWHRTRSISSACLILMLNRIELIEGSMSTRSFSLREMMRGLRSTSFDCLRSRSTSRGARAWNDARLSPNFDLGLVVSLYDLRRIWVSTIARVDQRTAPHLRREVLEGQRRGQGRPYCCEVWPECVGLRRKCAIVVNHIHSRS